MSRSLWLPTVARYLLTEFGRALFMTLSAFILLYLCIDFFERIPRFLQHDPTTAQVVIYFLLKIPLIVAQIMPAAVLAATLLGLGGLARRAELMAMRACGISLWQIATPIVLACGVLSVAMLAFNEYVVPPSAARSDYIETVEIKNKTYRAHFRQRELWYQDRRGFTNIDRFDPKKSEIHGLTRYEFNDDFQLRRIVSATLARWNGSGWDSEGAYEVIVAPSGEVETKTLEPNGLGLKETPKDFTGVYRDAEHMSYAALAEQTRQLAAKGINTQDSQVELWLKIALPFASLVMSLIAIPLASRHSRQSSSAANVGIALVVGFSYWVVLALTTSLGKGELLPPVVAAWTANALFALIGAVFFLGSE
ncbi:MAG: LPS export ABC transporter permease LptG [Candidatus Binatia bacterium]|nr:LPS export ABC transporter permease LptG [Candidatus Binatia bacterium]